MTGRSAAIQGGLAALGLLAAHLTWQRDPERAPGAATVIDASKSDVSVVHYADNSTVVDFRRGHGDNDAPVWIRIVKGEGALRHKDPAKDAAKDKKNDKADTKPDSKEEPDTPRDLRGSDQSAKLVDNFAPFVSPRAFGVLDAAKLKELGLDAPVRKLDVTVKGDVRHYEIGQPEKAAAGESFLRDTRDGRVYLMPRGMLADLQNPGHLVDRRLHAFDPGDFDRLVITSNGKSKEYVQTDRQVRAKATIASAKSPDKPDQMAKNWHDSLWRAFASDVLGRGEDPPGGKPATVLRVEYFDGKKSVGFDEFARVESSSDSSSAVSEEPTGSDVYVRTEHSAGWLKVGNGNQLITDAQKLVAAP
ncbi:MAG TPA: DUF4340 domain-containing protein [Polyangia bacterium]|nr:DUF4340 domain-containing protein [Polyangia bacterium]